MQWLTKYVAPKTLPYPGQKASATDANASAPAQTVTEPAPWIDWFAPKELPYPTAKASAPASSSPAPSAPAPSSSTPAQPSDPPASPLVLAVNGLQAGAYALMLVRTQPANAPAQPNAPAQQPPAQNAQPQQPPVQQPPAQQNAPAQAPAQQSAPAQPPVALPPAQPPASPSALTPSAPASPVASPKPPLSVFLTGYSLSPHFGRKTRAPEEERERHHTVEADPISFTVPPGCDQFTVSYGDIEANPEAGDLSERETERLIKQVQTERARLATDGDALEPGAKLYVVIPWRASHGVSIAAGRLRLPVFVYFFSSDSAE